MISLVKRKPPVSTSHVNENILGTRSLVFMHTQVKTKETKDRKRTNPQRNQEQSNSSVCYHYDCVSFISFNFLSIK